MWCTRDTTALIRSCDASDEDSYVMKRWREHVVDVEPGRYGMMC